ncbi:MAG: SpoIIIAH-like family protein [Eubacteriales bacterium]|jgi:stage III sporulation protein AH
MKKIASFIVKHKKSILVCCCLFIIGVSVYSDFILGAAKKKEVGTGSYLYTSEPSSDSAKILGEAKLVDNIGSSENVSAETSADSYFVSASLNRERSREEALETLQVVIDSAETMPDVKDKALDRMISIASEIETEALVEEMIKAKGFEDCLAVMTGDNINVIVKTPGLLSAEVAQITEIVMEETGYTAENIKIVEKN